MNTDLKSKLQQSLGTDKAPLSLPPETYRDDQLVKDEIAQIFRRQWIGLGRADLVNNPGDYICLDHAQQSIILLRDKTGALQAYANSCRHRGARLLDGSGHITGIRCPFHSWAYKISGELAGAPRMDDAGMGAESIDGDYQQFCKSDYGLIRYHLREHGGFVFICFDGNPPDFETVISGFDTLHAPWPMESLQSTRRREFEVSCNWKAFIEVFNEYYHLPFVHPDSIDDLYLDPDPSDQTDGQFATQFGSTEGTGALLQDQQDHLLPLMPGLKGREAAGVRYTWIFPNMTFAAGVDALWLYEAYPISADRCHVVQTACFPPETVAKPDFDEKVAAYYVRLDAALDEDIPALVNQQHGLNNPDARQGPFQPLLEPNVARFAQWYASQMLKQG